jgi:hypothetical protein
MTSHPIRGAAAVLVFWLGLASAQTGAVAPLPAPPWPATDALGRALPVAGDRATRAPRPDRYVGIFYFLWHDNHGGKRPDGDGPYDVAKILARDPDALKQVLDSTH